MKLRWEKNMDFLGYFPSTFHIRFFLCCWVKWTFILQVQSCIKEFIYKKNWIQTWCRNSLTRVSISWESQYRAQQGKVVDEWKSIPRCHIMKLVRWKWTFLTSKMFTLTRTMWASNGEHEWVGSMEKSELHCENVKMEKMENNNKNILIHLSCNRNT